MRPTQPFDYYVRSVTTALLAIAVLGVSAWQVVGSGKVSGPFVDWSGLVVGAYFVHYARNGGKTPKPPDDGTA